jgi:hypothetical protein
MRRLWALVGADGYYWTGLEFVPLFTPLRIGDCLLFTDRQWAVVEAERLKHSRRVLVTTAMVQVHQFIERRTPCVVGW